MAAQSPKVLDRTSTYFISDLHLEASRPHATHAFETFLREIETDAKALYILGDFVEAWIGDDDNSYYHQKLKTLLRKFVAKGIHIFLLHGNRDFLIGERFCRETGVTLVQENTCIDLHGTNALLLHGDSLCTGDSDYQAFREKVRNPAWQRKMLRYPLFIRKLIASYMRYKSRKANSGKPENIMDVSEQAVVEAFKSHQIKLMIHGHTHRPNRHTYHINNEEHERIVLGDWEQFVWYLKVNERDTSLLKHPMPTPDTR